MVTCALQGCLLRGKGLYCHISSLNYMQIQQADAHMQPKRYYPTVSTQNIIGMPCTWTFNQSRTYKEGINVDSSGEKGTIMRAYAVPIRPAPIIPNVCPFNKLPTNLYTTSMLHKCSCETCKILRVQSKSEDM